MERGDYASEMGAGREERLAGSFRLRLHSGGRQSGRGLWKAAEDAGLQPGSVSKRRRSVSEERMRSKAERKNAGYFGKLRTSSSTAFLAIILREAPLRMTVFTRISDLLLINIDTLLGD